MALEWWKVKGGIGVDERGKSIRQTADGGYIATGYTDSNDSLIMPGHHGGVDCYVAKYGFDGSLVWQKLLGGSSDDYGWYVLQTGDGGFLVFAVSSSMDGDVTNNNGSNLWVVKLDFNGNKIWDQSYLTSNISTYIYDVTPTSDGNYAMVVSGYDYEIFKVDTIGNVLWHKSYGGSFDDISTGIVEMPDHGFLVVGGAVSNDGDVICANVARAGWIIQLDSMGNLGYQTCFGGNNPDGFNSITKISNGDYLITGYAQSDVGFHTSHIGYPDLWIMKLDSTLGVEFSEQYGGTNYDYGIEAIETDYGFVVGGYSNSNDVDVTGNHGDYDCWMVAVNDTGGLIWQQSYGDAGFNGFAELHATDDGGIIGAGRSDDDLLFMKFVSDYNAIEGQMFFDANSNLTHDGGENPVAYKALTETTSGRIAFTHADGTYQMIATDTGSYTVMPAPLAYCTPVPVQHSVNFSAMHVTDTVNDFAMQPAASANDLLVTLSPISAFRPGTGAYYALNYNNNGTTTVNGTAYFFPADSVAFVSASVTPAAVTVDSVSWNLGTLAPFSSGSILITVMPDVAVAVGSTVTSAARVDPVTADFTPADNAASATTVITASLDPNFILVDKETIDASQLANPPYLEYVINYQNTGNDTAFIVRIKNDISPLVDMSTFELLATSHPSMIKYDAVAGQLEFMMNNIQLPDSATDEPGSHGFIRYKIKPVSTLITTDTIKSSAAIYFDYNMPVYTNTALTWIGFTSSIASMGIDGGISIYPNPATDACMVHAPGFKDAIIYIRNMEGRLIKSYPFNERLTINLSSISSGVYLIEITDQAKNTIRRKIIR